MNNKDYGPSEEAGKGQALSDIRAGWWAIVGPSLHASAGGILITPHDSAAGLEGVHQLGPLRIRSGGRCLVEFTRPEPQVLHGVSTHRSWPVIVEGDGAGDRFGREQARDLRRLACLLSIAWREPWVVRTSPTDADSLPAEIPDSWPSPSRSPSDQRLTAPVPRTLPPIVLSGWARTERDPLLSRLLVAWHVSFLAMAESPSLAFVGFVGILEQAHRFAEKSPVEGSRQQVESAIDRWASGYEAALLRSRRGVYNVRSASVHSASLFGLEEQASRLISIDMNTPAGGDPYDGDDATFQLRELGAIEAVARRSLCGLLQEGGEASDTGR